MAVSWVIRITWSPWHRVERAHVVGVAAFTSLLLAFLLAGDPGWTPILDSANLAFHEVGHVAYGAFGATAGLYGGVLGQLTFPLVTLVAFAVRREAVGVAVGGIWAAQNLFNIARYMADARAQELPLVGGGEHDFWNIFARWGVLPRDLVIASVTRGLGWLGIALALGWLLWRFRASERDATA